MSIAKPFTFVANTYAKASEVNANFDTVYSQVNSNISAISQNAVDIENLENNKADINGNTAQRFAVADAITDSDAINKRTLRASIANSIDYISGFIITKDSGNPNNTIIVSEGSCYDSTKTVVLNKTNSSTKTNSGQAANATYYVYIIGNALGTQIDVLISSSSTTPALPSGYSLFRKIGYFTTDGNNNISVIHQLSNSALFDVNSVMPDYSTSASYVKGTTYTVSSPGVLFTHNTSTTDDGETRVRITYKGVSRDFTSQSSSEDTDYTHDTMTFPLPIGASFIVWSSGNIDIWFFKCIGG